MERLDETADFNYRRTRVRAQFYFCALADGDNAVEIPDHDGESRHSTIQIERRGRDFLEPATSLARGVETAPRLALRFQSAACLAQRFEAAACLA